MKWSEMSPRQRDILVGTHFSKGVKDSFERYGEDAFFVGNFNRLGVLCGCPNYTTDISSAWKIVQTMKETHWFELRAGTLAESASFGDHFSKQTVIAQCKTAPESICLAALKAVGVDIE